MREGFFAVRGFCLMPTHYHLFAWFEDSKLTAGRQRLNRRYAGGFNRRHQRRGHVFDVPFTSVHVEKHEHFEWLDEYIASNPHGGRGRGAPTTASSASQLANQVRSAKLIRGASASP